MTIAAKVMDVIRHFIRFYSLNRSQPAFGKPSALFAQDGIIRCVEADRTTYFGLTNWAERRPGQRDEGSSYHLLSHSTGQRGSAGAVIF
jgi:hypothetical protein